MPLSIDKKPEFQQNASATSTWQSDSEALQFQTNCLKRQAGDILACARPLTLVDADGAKLCGIEIVKDKLAMCSSPGTGWSF